MKWGLTAGISFQTNAAGGLVGLAVQTSGLQPNLDQPRTHVWMLSVQRDLGHGLFAEADYNGSRSSHLYVQTDGNPFPGVLILNKGNQARLNSNLGGSIYSRKLRNADGNYATPLLGKRFH